MPELGDAEVHVWRYDLARAGDAAPGAALSAEEAERARRLRDPMDRRRFVHARAGLRALLSAYTGRAPADIEILQDCLHCGQDHGKPRLGGPGGGLTFNLSHSCGRVVYAVAKGREVGVDVEHSHLDAAACQDVSEALGRPALRIPGVDPARLPREPRSVTQAWTQAEAYLKLLGHGIASAGDIPARDDISLLPLDLGACYAGTLAVEGRPEAVRHYEFKGPHP